MKTSFCILFLIFNSLLAELPHRIKVIKGTKNSAITNSLKIIYKEYTSSLLNLQTELVSSNRFEDANTIQNEYHQNLEYAAWLNRGSYQFVFSSQKPLPSEASIYRETRNSKTQILLKRHIDNYINELKKAQAFYMSNRDLVSSRKATDEMRLATLELKKISAVTNSKSIPNDAKIFKEHKYKCIIADEGVTWHEAKLRCETLGGYLAKIDSQEEVKFISKLVPKGRVPFLGASDEVQKGKWLWIDGMVVQTYLKNKIKEIGKPDRNYLGMTEWGLIAKRNYAREFICEWD